MARHARRATRGGFVRRRGVRLGLAGNRPEVRRGHARLDYGAAHLRTVRRRRPSAMRTFPLLLPVLLAATPIDRGLLGFARQSCGSAARNLASSASARRRRSPGSVTGRGSLLARSALKPAIGSSLA